MGAGHSFSALVETSDILLSLDALSGIVEVNAESGEVTLWGGTRIRDIAGLLAPFGLALPNMGDIDAQSIAGAVSTSTHGTGARFTGYSGIVTGLRMVLADGSIITAEGRLFEAARVSLGVLGIITQVTLQCVPAFVLESRETTEPISEVLSSYLERAETADHLEFFWFPGTPRATVKELRRLPADSEIKPLGTVSNLLNREILCNGVFGAIDLAASRVPSLAPPVRSVASKLMAGSSFSDESHRVFVAPRRVRFHETEYAMPIEVFPDVVRDVEQAIVRSGEELTFPLEIRVAAADDTWLGTASGRDSVYVAVHRYHREQFAPVLAAVEPVFAAYGGRPHWGKEHSLTDTELATLYAKFDDFQLVRDEIDPEGMLLNAHTRRLLGR